MFNLKQIIEELSKVTESTASILDHIICSHDDKVVQLRSIPVGISDHNIIFCTR